MFKSRIIYICIIISAFIFSQALYDSISLFTLVCVLLLPVFSLLLMLCCFSLVKIRCRLARGQVYRYSETTLLVEIKCGLPFICPLLKINCIVNDPDGKESVIRNLPISFSPMSTTVIKIPISYSYRGAYKIGVQNVEIYDFLRLFKLRKRIGQYFKLYVTPRFLPSELQVSQNVYLEEGTSSDMLASRGYGAELFGVRDYEDTDSLRFVHWNLSAAKGELLVKTYSVNRQKQIYLLVDLSAEDHHSFEARRMGDVILETGLSLCRDLLSQVGSVCLMWQNGGLKEHSIEAPHHLSAAYEEIGLSPLQNEKAFDQLSAELSNIQALCIVTGRLTKNKLSRIEMVQSGLCCPVRLIAFENECEADLQMLLAKNISLEFLSLEEVEKGRVVS